MANITIVWDFLKQNNKWVSDVNDGITIGKAVISIVDTIFSDDPAGSPRSPRRAQ